MSKPKCDLPILGGRCGYPVDFYHERHRLPYGYGDGFRFSAKQPEIHEPFQRDPDGTIRATRKIEKGEDISMPVEWVNQLRREVLGNMGEDSRTPTEELKWSSLG